MGVRQIPLNKGTMGLYPIGQKFVSDSSYCLKRAEKVSPTLLRVVTTEPNSSDCLVNIREVHHTDDLFAVDHFMGFTCLEEIINQYI